VTGKNASPRLPAAYWRLWWAAAVDNLGDGAFIAAVPLLAVTITHDPLLISVVSAATYVPALLLSIPAGAIIDRHDRVALMWRSQAIEAVIVGVVAILAAAGAVGIPVLAVMAFGLGACEVVFVNASQAILPDIVSSSQLHRANGAQYTVTAIGQQFAGPPVGSLLFAVAVALPFGLDAGSFALSAVLLATLPRRREPRPEHPKLRAAMTEGIRWLASHPLLRVLAVLVGVNTFCFQLGFVTLVLLATQTLHLSARGYGVLLAGAAAGSVLGGLVSARIVARIGQVPALLISLIANVLVFEGIGFSPDPVVLGALLALNGFVTTMWSIGVVSLRQQVVPSQLLGRVTSAYRMLASGLMPLGALAGGLVASELGVRAAFPVAGAIRGVALTAALPFLIKARRTPRRADGGHQRPEPRSGRPAPTGQNGRVSSFVSSDGTEIAYRVTGEGPPLVCLPGGPGRSAEYLGDLGGLARSRQLVLVDLRGTGLSASPADPASFRVDRDRTLPVGREPGGLRRRRGLLPELTAGPPRPGSLKCGWRVAGSGAWVGPS
jgi:MFS family permease